MQYKIKKISNCIAFIMMTLFLCACTGGSSSVIKKEPTEPDFNNSASDFAIKESDSETISDIKKEELEIQYANGFTIDLIDNDYYLITSGNQRILIVPEGKDVPDWAEFYKGNNEEEFIILNQPLNNIYVAATSVPDMIDCLGKLDNISYTSTTYEDWALDSMRDAIEGLAIEYVGKYRAPDYEVLLANGCSLAIESTMIYHSPEVSEKLNALGIPVIVETSSYENDPLGRLEWIKVYGALLNCYDESVTIFNNKVSSVNDLYNKATTTDNKKTIAFFYINSNGSVVVRKPGDYVTKMIDMAGGEYIIKSLPKEDNALSTMNMQMEAFYAEAINADIIIYNSTIDGEINSIEELIKKSELLKDFKAVKNGNVWCSGKNMFQQSSATAEMIDDLNKLLNDENELEYFHKLQ